MKKFLMAGIVATTMMFAAAPAAAQVQFTGTATGCFGAACAPVAGPSVNDGLTYVSGSFNQATDNTGHLGIGGATDNFGSFTLTGLPAVYTGDVFRLLVSFSAPAATNPPNTLFDILLQGTVTGVNAGGVTVNFDNTPLLFDSAAGQFTFAINDVAISSDSAVQFISGTIQAAVPEPGTWAMMLLGFGAIGFAMRRRRQPLMQLA